MFSDIIDAVSIEEREHKNKQCGQEEGLFNMQQVNFMVTPCINNIQHFNIQYTLTQCKVHTPHRSQYAVITLTTASTYLLLTKRVILAKY
jgi:hypothetical protein